MPRHSGSRPEGPIARNPVIGSRRYWIRARRYAAPRNDKFHGIDRLVKTKRGKETAYEAKTVTLAGAALHRLPQPSGGRKGRRRPGRDRGGADFTALGAASRQRRAEHRNRRLPIQFPSLSWTC
jgi:hypothetical protein